MTQGVAANGSGVADMATAAAGNAQATGPSPAAAGGAAGTTDGTAAVPNATDVARALGAPAQTTGTLKRPRKKYAKFPADVQKRIDALRAKIEEDKYDGDAWNDLLKEIKLRQQSTEVKDILNEVYSEMIDVFPSSSIAWRGFIELEMSAGNDDAVKQMFGQCLFKCKNLELWRTYIRYVKKVNDATTPQGLNEIKQTYEFTLDQLGTDIAAGPLWLEYLHFLQNADAVTLFGQTGLGNEESAKLMSIRRAYKRAVTIPTHSVDAIWRNYGTFENGVNKQLAKQLMNELQGQYTNAHTVYRELKRKWLGIKETALAVPPSKAGKAQETLWSKLIAFEKGNPVKLEQAAMVSRLSLVYEQCLQCFYHYPAFWYDYASWHADNERQEKASQTFKDACDALPSCPVIHFAAADFEAACGNVQGAKDIYEALIARQGELEADLQAQVWVQYMRFVRRTEGADESRKLFVKRARKSANCSHLIFSTAALLEWQHTKDMKIAKNIFELGLKSHIKETAFVLAYARFLVSQSDIANARTLFERALTVAQGDDAKSIWDAFLRFEYQCGDLQSTIGVEKRRRQALVLMNAEDAQEYLEKEHVQKFDTLRLRYSSAADAALEVEGETEAGGEEAGWLASTVGLGEASTEGRPGIPRLPPVIQSILKRLPAAAALKGPRPTLHDVDYVIGTLLKADINAMKNKDLDAQAERNERRGMKRNNVEGPGSQQANAPPPNDVYRMRQKMKL